MTTAALHLQSETAHSVWWQSGQLCSLRKSSSWWERRGGTFSGATGLLPSAPHEAGDWCSAPSDVCNDTEAGIWGQGFVLPRGEGKPGFTLPFIPQELGPGSLGDRKRARHGFRIPNSQLCHSGLPGECVLHQIPARSSAKRVPSQLWAQKARRVPCHGSMSHGPRGPL